MKFYFFKVNNKENNSKILNVLKRLLFRLRKNMLFVLIIAFVIIIIKVGFVKFSEYKEKSKPKEVHEEESVEIETNIPKDDMKPVITSSNIQQYSDFNNLKKYVYAVDESAYVFQDDFKINKFMNMDFKIEIDEAPKILIFHTHSQEDFIDSQTGKVEDTIVGIGRYLANILVDQYGVNVVHDIGEYDVVNGEVRRGGSYENMEKAELKILEKYPSIEIIIDLHRDGIENGKFVTNINGKDTAKIMFFNGISRKNNNGVPEELTGLENPYIEENLGFSLQMFLKANEKYPSLCRRNYIKPYRYSLHMLPKSLLVEVGANTSTVEEAKNAMHPLAEILMDVIS